MNRTFKALRATSSNDDAFELSWGERFDESGISWDELLKSQRVLIVSEAGAGKTYECESKARELFARGEPAFFLSLESVASAGVVANLFGDEHERFTNWLASSSQLAYFFLDSIDELQLVHRSFKDALRRFENDIRGAMGRATVVVTARPVPIDRLAFRDILTLEFHRHVRSEDDLVHDTVYSPGARDFAENGCRYIFDALMKTSGQEALSAKLALAADPLFERLRDRIAALAHERLAAEIDSSAWTPTEVATLLSRKELSPKTATDMAQLLVDRLDDLQELLLKDTGPRAGWASIDDENTLRPLIARELEVASREAYTVDQEAVTADGKETDIRLRSVSGYQATIELKIGEKGRSARELCDTIDEQLVKKYMAHRDARTGCLLVSVSNPGRHWQHPDTGERIDRVGLQALLQKKADEAQRRLGGEARILARVLDVVPRLSTEKQAAGTA